MDDKLKKVFISYVDESGETWSGYVELVSKDNAFVVFKSAANIISIPTARVLKIKEKLGDNNG